MFRVSWRILIHGEEVNADHDRRPSSQLMKFVASDRSSMRAGKTERRGRWS